MGSLYLSREAQMAPTRIVAQCWRALDRKLLYGLCYLFGDHLNAEQKLPAGSGFISITSDDRKYTVKINTCRPLVHLKRKKDGTYVGVYHALLKDREIIVKVFLALDGRQSDDYGLQEVKAPKQLTQRKCTAAPEYLGDFRKVYAGILCGTEHYVLMSKLPGVPFSICRWTMPAMELSAVRVAFEKAMREVHRCEVDNGPGANHDENILWDAARLQCYIVDFEKAIFGPCTTHEELDEWMHKNLPTAWRPKTKGRPRGK